MQSMYQARPMISSCKIETQNVDGYVLKQQQQHLPIAKGESSESSELYAFKWKMQVTFSHIQFRAAACFIISKCFLVQKHIDHKSNVFFSFTFSF